jgi:hypothetical protein
VNKKKPPSLAVSLKFGFEFCLRTLTAFHRLEAGIAKVKEEVSVKR